MSNLITRSIHKQAAIDKLARLDEAIGHLSPKDAYLSARQLGKTSRTGVLLSLMRERDILRVELSLPKGDG